MRKLSINEKMADIPIYACKSWNGTGILVQAGEKYRIDANNELWSDAGIKCTAAGQPGNYIQNIFKALIRCPQAQWFELVATVSNSPKNMLPIGLGADVTFNTEKSGELGFFANDVIFMYWNNSGVTHVTITRIT